MEQFQNPTQEPNQNPVSQAKSSWIIIISSILGIVLLTSIFFLYQQNQQLKKQVINQQVTPTIQAPSPTPKKVLSITITPDEMANWKIYKSDKYFFELKYPNNWTYNEGLSNVVFSSLGKPVPSQQNEVFSPISVLISKNDIFDLSTNSLTDYEEKKLVVAGIETIQQSGVTKTDFQNKVRFTGIKLIHNGYVYTIFAAGTTYISIYEKILSTFKFTTPYR